MTCSGFHRGLLGVVIGLFCGLSAEVHYDITDLGAIELDTVSSAKAINDLAQVAGFSMLPAEKQTRAMLWVPDGEMRDLSAKDSIFSVSKGLNQKGVVVGRARFEDRPVHAFFWTPVHGMTMLPGILHDSFSAASGINDEGVIVGTCSVDEHAHHAVVWVPKEPVQDIGTLGGYCSVAVAINNSNQVVGRSGLRCGHNHAFLWEKEKGMRDLGTLGGDLSGARAINNSGWVVGYAHNKEGHTHAFLWKKGEGMLDLGTLGDNISIANGINEAGQIVGIAMTHEFPRAFTWDEKNGMWDLNHLIDRESGWHLFIASGINNRGEIVGVGQHGGHFRGFLLRPAPPKKSTPVPAACDECNF